MIALATIILAAAIPTSPTLETATSFAKLGARPSAGSVRDEKGQRRYMLNVDVALEHFQNGKRDPEIEQQWLLHCESPAASGESGTSCGLMRTVLDHWGKAVNLGTICYQSRHTTADHSMEVVAANWPEGKLELNVIHDDGSKTHVLIGLAYDKQDILLESLNATLTFRGVPGPAATVDLRVPDFTYVQQVPVVMKGMKTAWEREWETFLSTLAPDDQAVARRLTAAREQIMDRVVETLYKASEKAKREQEQAEPASPAAAKEMSERLSAEAGTAFVEYVTEWLEKSEMSASAKKSTIEFLRSH